MTPAMVTPMSIELEKGPSGMRLGSKGSSAKEMATRIVPGNVIFKASLCMASLLVSSNIMAEKKNVKNTEFMTKVIDASKSAMNASFSVDASKSVMNTSFSPFAKASYQQTRVA